MSKFRYTAMDAKGSEQSGTIEATDQSNAISKLRSQGLFPIRVIEDVPVKQYRLRPTKLYRPRISLVDRLPRFGIGRVSQAELCEFSRRCSVLMDAGLPLLRVLRILKKQEKNAKLAKAIEGLGEAIESGSTFSEALTQYPRIFNKMFINMVKAGEAGGVLDVIMSRLADYLEKEMTIKRNVASSFILLTTSSLVLSVLLSTLTNTIGMGIVLGPIVFVALVLWIMRKYYKVVKYKRISLFCRMFGTLMSSGVPVLQTLNILRDGCEGRKLAKAAQMVHDAVKEGDCVATALDCSKGFPSFAVNMIDVGEETGALPDCLIRIADCYEKEVDLFISRTNLFNSTALAISMAILTAMILMR